ncbi:5328_t:CDS:1 [Scutellospora calospora]|uniref:5328_t:CDS:1 n=1 Tax=Scutellospora calospora TaxID=85575 RepID=A0ACA9LMN5_9GLOM|nr:5328_t:CDS:1 [Scutellospora calospora]
MPKVKFVGYYAVRLGHKPGIYVSWDDCKRQIDKYPSAVYKKFYALQDAERYIKPDINVPNEEKIDIYTDGYCKNNGKPNAIASLGVYWPNNEYTNLSERLPGFNQTNNRAELYAVIRALETCEKESKYLEINTDSMYVINCRGSVNPKVNVNLVNYLNELINARNKKVIFNHVKGHSGIDGNEMADKLALQGASKPHVPKFEFKLSINKNIQEYLDDKDYVDDSKNATKSYLSEFNNILQVLETKNDQLVIKTRNINIYHMLKNNMIQKWLNNNWCTKRDGKKLKAPKYICIKINDVINTTTNPIDLVFIDKNDTIKHQTVLNKY